MAEERAKRKLSAILAADVKGYSRLMGEDELATIETLKKYRDIMGTLVGRFQGRVVDSPGDNVLAEFPSVVDAVECAVEIQKELKRRNSELPRNRKMEFRMGINLGDVIADGARIYGDGVNIAARVESLAEGGGICISGTVYDQVENKLKVKYEYLGEQDVKNITKPVRVYRIRIDSKDTVSEISRRLKLPDEPSIAVLPFVNMSDDPKQDFFSDGMTEEIITALSKTPKLFVIARNSSFAYKGKAVNVQQVSRELGVKYVLEGSVRKSGNQVRITAQLIDAMTGNHLWAERYDRELKEIFAIQDDVAIRVLTALRVALTDGEIAHLQGRGVSNIDAFFKLLEAHTLIQAVNKESNARARRLAEDALLVEPGSSRAHFLLASTHFADFWVGPPKSQAESIAQGIAMAQKTIEMDPYNAAAHSLLGMLYVTKGEYDKAVEEGERGASMDPNSVTAVYLYGSTLMHASRYEEAIPILEKAIRLSPLNPPLQCLVNLGASYAYLGNYDEAVRYLKRVIQEEPNQYLANLVLTSVYAEMGRLEEARAQAAQVLRLNPKFSLESFSKTLRIKSPAQVDRFLDELRKAGLPEKPPLPLPDKSSIAVLPFVNISGDPEQEYFSEGITEEIITALSKTPKLFVIARNSTFAYKGKPVKVQQVGRELGVKYVLEGSVRKAENKVRITAQLVDAQTGHHLWADRYDRELKEIFALQDEITMKILIAMQVKLTEGDQARLYGKGTDNLEAYLKLLQGRQYIDNISRENNALAQQVLAEAIALDPGYGEAYTYFAVTHFLDTVLGFSKSPGSSLANGIDLAQKAIALDDSEANPHSILGLLLTMKGEYEISVAEGERAVELNPNSADAHARLAITLNSLGRREEAIASFKQAIRLNPIPPVFYLVQMSLAYAMTERYEEALAACEKAVHREPDNLIARIFLAANYGLAGRAEEARVEAAEVIRISPKFSLGYASKTWPFKEADRGRFLEALRKAGLK
jgi:adenylate cyclase